jgi:hypothetical protein
MVLSSYSLPFLVRPEYTLSLIRLVRPSFETRRHLLSEPSPCSIITSLGAWLLIIQSFTFLPLDTTINRGPLETFRNQSGSKSSQELPAIWRRRLSTFSLTGKVEPNILHLTLTFS